MSASLPDILGRLWCRSPLDRQVRQRRMRRRGALADTVFMGSRRRQRIRRAYPSAAAAP